MNNLLKRVDSRRCLAKMRQIGYLGLLEHEFEGLFSGVPAHIIFLKI
jgi:hypothetical protein